MLIQKSVLISFKKKNVAVILLFFMAKEETKKIVLSIIVTRTVYAGKKVLADLSKHSIR